jgi:hypothetical protein
MLPSSMTSRTVDPPEPSLPPTDAGTQESTPAPPSQSSREPSLFSRLSSRFNKTQKITVEPKKITVEPIKASYVATKDKEKPAIGTAVGKNFLKTFDHIVDQSPEWFNGIFLKLLSRSDQQQPVSSSHTEGQDCHLYWRKSGISFEGWLLQGSEDKDIVFEVGKGDHNELAKWPLRKHTIACLLVSQDGTSFVVTFEPIIEPDPSKGEEQYKLPFSIYNCQDMVFASQ